MEKTLVYDDELKYLEEVERAAREFHRMYWLREHLKNIGREDDDMNVQFMLAEQNLRTLLHVDLNALFKTFDWIYKQIGYFDDDAYEEADIERQWGDRINHARKPAPEALKGIKEKLEEFKPAPEAAKELRQLLEQDTNGDD